MTDILAVFARVLLFVVLAGAAVAKTPFTGAGRVRFAAFADSLTGLPVVARDRRAVAALTVAAETVAALALVIAPSAGWSAAPAAVVLLALSAGVGYVLVTGARVECHCFGSAGAEVLGRGTLLRNAMLSVGAVALTQVHSMPSSAPLALVAGAAGALAGLAVTHWDDLRWLAFAPAR